MKHTKQRVYIMEALAKSVEARTNIKALYWEVLREMGFIQNGKLIRKHMLLAPKEKTIENLFYKMRIEAGGVEGLLPWIERQKKSRDEQ